MGRPVLLLGLDGLGFPFLDAPLVREAAPNLHALLAASSLGPLRSTLPPYTAPAWTSITTGVNPGRHGVFGFTHGDGRAVSDRDVAAPRIWDILAASGGRSVVVNVPITYPPRPIAGAMVSGMPVPPGASFTSPPELADELARFDYVIDVPVREHGQDSTRVLDHLRRMTEARGRAVSWMAGRETWDLFAVVFVLPDRIGHSWWKYLVPGSPLYDSRAGERTRAAARTSLEALDNSVGDLLGALPSRTATVLCSDHGFGPLRADVFFDVVLAQQGVNEVPSPSLRSRMLVAAGRSRLEKLAPQWLHTWARRKGTASRSSGTWRAWTAPAYETGVRLADPSDDALRARVTDALLSMREADGRAVVARVVRREELFDGPWSDGAPELLCTMSDESVDLHDGLHARQAWVSRDHLPWGTHASEGVVAVAGAEARAGLNAEAVDVAPTVLALLGLEADGLDGHSLVPVPEDAHRPAEAAAVPDLAQGPAYSQDEEAAVLEHLRGLGYVD